MNTQHPIRMVLAAVALTWATWTWFLAPRAMHAAWGAEPTLLVHELDGDATPKVTVVVSPPAETRGAVFDASAFSVRVGDIPVPVSVERLPGGDLDVVLVVDTSGSMAGAPIDAARSAAAQFASKLPASARVAVIGFGPTASVVSPFGTDRAATTAAIGALTARGETALYDAVLLAARSFPEGGGRRSIVLLSDGGDTASTSSIDAAVAGLGTSRARLDVVGLRTADSDDASVARLAEAAGGRVVPAGDPAALAGVYDDVAQSLVNRYRLGFTAPGEGRAVARIELRHATGTASAEVDIELPAAVPAPAPAPKPPVVPVERVEPETSWTASRWMLVAGAGTFFVALLLAGAVALVPRRRSWRLARLGQADASASHSTMVVEWAHRAGEAAERALDRQGRRAGLNAALERAGIALRPGEFAVMAGSAAFLALMVGLLVGGPLIALLLAGVALLGCRSVVDHLAEKRRVHFAGQLGDTLQLLAGSLRAGYGLLQAVDAVAREAESPTADEFRRVVVETRLGRDLSESLTAMAARVGGDDFTWVVQAIDIHREVGGDLAEILDTVGDTIREREQLRRQVKALTAEGRLSAYILLALPFVLVAALGVLNRAYVLELTRGTGVVFSVLGLLFMAAGAVWFKKLIRFRY